MKFQHYETDPDQLWHLRFVHFFGGTSEQYYKTFRAESDSVVHLPPASRLPVYLDRLLADYQPATRNSDLLAAMYLAQMLTELILNNRTAAPDHWQDYAREIAQYIDDHFAEELTLDSLARRFSLSKTYLPKKFKAQYGISPTEYLACIRIKKAKEYLHDTDYPVCKVAEMVGIDNPSYFIKLFKRHEKLTPYAYHSKWKSIYPDRGGRAL